jgi:hypothetical protein
MPSALYPENSGTATARLGLNSSGATTTVNETNAAPMRYQAGASTFCVSRINHVATIGVVPPSTPTHKL